MDELLELIAETLGDNEEASTKLKNAIVGELQKQKDVIYKKDQENLKLKTKFKDIGYDKDKYDSYDEFVNSLKSEQETYKTKVEESELTLKGVNEKVNQYQTQLEQALSQVNTLVSEKEAIAKEAKTSKVKTALTERLNGKVYGSEFVIDSIMTKYDTHINGDSVKFKNGEDFLGIDEFVNGFLEENKSIQILDQKSGTESDAGERGSNGPKDFVSQLGDRMNKR